MSSYSACCRPNRDVQRIERAFERHGKSVVVWELTGNRGYVVSGSERKVIYKSVTAAVRAARQWCDISPPSGGRFFGGYNGTDHNSRSIG